MSAKFIGPGLVLLFCVSQAFRDVYFANVFQGVDFFVVIIVAFTLAIVVFGGVALLRNPVEFIRLRGEIAALFWMNALTALAWTSYFFSLKYQQPSIVNALHSGAAPLTVVILARFGIHIARPSPMHRIELLGYLGVAGSLLFLWWVVLADRSGLRAHDPAVSLAGIVLPLVSGTAITISSLWTKRLHERGIGAETVTAMRYVLIVGIAWIVVRSGQRSSGIGTPDQFMLLAVAAMALIVLPLYCLQLGIARTTPLTTHTIRALGPAVVLGMELLDGRIHYSGAVLVGIALYSVFAVVSNLLHGRQRDSDLERGMVKGHA